MSLAPVAPRTISDADVEAVIVRTLEDKPTDATHWSTRDLAKKVGMSASVGRSDLAGVRVETVCHTNGFGSLFQCSGLP